MDKYSATMKKGDSKLLIRNLRKMKEQQTENQSLDLFNVVKRTLERKEAAYACVNMWYEKECDSSTPEDEVASMDKEAAGLNAQIKVLRHILSEVGEL